MAHISCTTFAFLMLLALQNESFAHGSNQQQLRITDDAIAMLVKHRSQRSIQHLNKHQQHSIYREQSTLDSNAQDEEALAAAAIHNKHLLRHLEHKRLQELQHEELLLEHKLASMEVQERGSIDGHWEKVPRLWQMLQKASDVKEQHDNDSGLASAANTAETANNYIDALKDLLLADNEEAQQPEQADQPEQTEQPELTIETPMEQIIIDDKSLSKEIIVKVPQNGSTTAVHEFRCPRCENARKVETISEEELTRLRIEFVKQQILEKLRLKEAPKFSAKGLPKPIYEGTTTDDHEDDESKNKDLDDYYARTSKKFIFLERETEKCQQFGGNRSICFSFKIDDADADGFDVNTAVLWIFKNKVHKRNLTFNDQETIVVSEMQQPTPNAEYIPIMKPIAMQTVDVQDKWMKINIDWPIKNWFGKHELNHIIHISCQSCDVNAMANMISVDKDYRPFIMVDTQNRRRPSRQKRSINCSDGITACCREKLYISFDEIGWGDWIVQPRGYDAYFCRGNCDSVASITQSSSHHNTFMQRFIAQRRSDGNKPLELIPCCTAKQYSSLQLVFMDSNNTATQKTFPNMVVESCGCR